MRFRKPRFGNGTGETSDSESEEDEEEELEEFEALDTSIYTEHPPNDGRII